MLNEVLSSAGLNTQRGSGYQLPTYPFEVPPELGGGKTRRYPVVVVGAGLGGLTAACDLATREVDCIVLDDDNTVGVRGLASRGICYAQKSLEIFERLGVYQRIAEKGVHWSKGRTLADWDEVYSFDLAATSLSAQPPFINIQQFYIEWFLAERFSQLRRGALRWKSKVIDVSQREDGVALRVETPAGTYAIEADWVIDASGVNSLIRDTFKLDAHAARGQDRWCICDVRFKKPYPIERWTWIQAPFNENRAVWQHPMADGVWRLDYQMDANADPEEVSRKDVVLERVREQLGADTEFEVVWVGPYAYRTQLLDNFRLGRVFFLGDCAHVMSPFGARGGNSAIQDAENIAWKLALVLQGKAPEALLDSYSVERRAAAVHNIETTSRTTRFLSPESPAERLLRDAVTALAREYAFARALVNTGRMSVPFVYGESPLTTNGGQHVQNVPIVLPDGKSGSLIDLARGAVRYIGLSFVADTYQSTDLQQTIDSNHGDVPLEVYAVSQKTSARQIVDAQGKLAQALQARAGSFCLIRPDAHLAAHLMQPSAAQVRAAVERGLGVSAGRAAGASELCELS